MEHSSSSSGLLSQTQTMQFRNKKYPQYNSSFSNQRQETESIQPVIQQTTPVNQPVVLQFKQQPLHNNQYSSLQTTQKPMVTGQQQIQSNTVVNQTLSQQPQKSLLFDQQPVQITTSVNQNLGQKDNQQYLHHSVPINQQQYVQSVQQNQQSNIFNQNHPNKTVVKTVQHNQSFVQQNQSNQTNQIVLKNVQHDQSYIQPSQAFFQTPVIINNQPIQSPVKVHQQNIQPQTQQVNQSNIQQNVPLQIDQLQTFNGNQPLKVNLNPNNTWSYYLQYSDVFDFTPGVINMFGYARVSTQLQAQFGSSIVTQIQLLYDECQRYQYDDNNRKLKYNILRIYVDDGISAKNITDRPGLVELKNYTSSLVTGRTHQKMGIIVSDLSRLTRSSADLESIIKWVTDDAIKLKFIDNSIDPSTNSGKLMLSMMANFFEFERKNSSFKTRLTLRSMSENGTLAGHCSYGWTSGVDGNGRKINIPVPDEQIGLNEIIRISRANPNATACEIKNYMNKSGIPCLRGPGRNLRGNKITDKTLKNIDPAIWTGEWSIQIIEKIMEHDRFAARQQLVKANTQSGINGINGPINIMKKDEIVVKIIKDHLEATNGYNQDSFNFSEMARMINDKNVFNKELDRNYVKQMMLASKIIKPEPISTIVQDDNAILNTIKGLIISEAITTYVKLTEVLIEKQIPLIGKRKNWNKTNIRDLCIKYGIKL